MKIIALLLSLSLLVITHELGHLCFSKLFHTLTDALVVGGYVCLSQDGDGLFIDALDDGFATQHG